jgi:hypothetical protein
MGQLGPAMIFVSLLLAEVMLGICVLGYAARCFGVIVEGTAAGNDEVRWPDEPMFDWLGRAAHLLFLVAVVLAPGAVVGRVLVRLNLGVPPALSVLPSAVLFWLLFPIVLLSSYSAASRWSVLRPALLGGLTRVFPTTLAFYALTALLLSVLGALAFATFAAGVVLLTPVLAAGAAAGVFVYARLLGRLGLVLGQLEGLEPPDAAPTRAPGPPQETPRKRRKRRIKVVDPWAVPDYDAGPPPSLPVEGYGVAAEGTAGKPAEPPPERQPKKKPRVKGYTVSNEAPPPPPKEAPLDGYLPVGDEGGERAASVRPPAHPFLEGVYTFPWYGESVLAWLMVALGLLAMGGLLQVLIALWGQLH